jgi:DNA-binding GntR family transcriptional regulator
VEEVNSLTEALRIYISLRNDIISCDLQPGDSVSEAELCSRYKASRTPIREACRRLQEEGLLQIVPFRGYFISPLTFEEFRNLNEMQLVLDPAAAAMAAERATAEQITNIEKWANYVYHAGQKKSYETFLEWNRNLHIEIAAASGNEMMAEITSNLQTRLIRYFYLVISMASYGKELVGEHHAIVRAIRARKPEQARDRATEHVIRTIERTALIKFPSGGHGADIRKSEAYPVRSRSNRASTHREIL